jgi:hypothetical protein
MSRGTEPRMYVRVDAIGQAGLSAGQALDTMSLALHELGTAQALAMIHGPERGYRRYVELGGCVRFTPWGDPYVPVWPPSRSLDDEARRRFGCETCGAEVGEGCRTVASGAPLQRVHGRRLKKVRARG